MPSPTLTYLTSQPYTPFCSLPFSFPTNLALWSAPPARLQNPLTRKTTTETMANAPNPPQHLSAAPVFPYGRESVLSTRSLSYLSNDALSSSSPNQPPIQPTQSRNTSTNLSRSRTRRSDLTSESEYGLEMTDARDQELKDIPELPESVAESPLFLLPREIRDRIYGFCLTSQNVRQVEWPSAWKSFTLQPQLLRTCKIIYNEAAPLLYAVNILTFHHPSDANMFMRAISAPSMGRHVANISLHIKAQDIRLWTPYLTSRDPNRSLKADFPNLRELSIRYRSNKWQHSIPPESNMRHWTDDSSLMEVIDGLRHVYLPDVPHGPKNEGEFETWLSTHSGSFPLNPGDPSFQKQWLEIHKARSAFTAKRESTPNIRVVCACRVHATHYTALTTSTPRPVRDLTRPGNGTGVIQQQSDDVFTPPAPVREGEPFRGFTPIDFRAGMKRLHDPELGSANVARTPFADKNGILLALEIHCLDPRRDNPNAPATAAPAPP